MKECLVCNGTLVWQAQLGTMHVCNKCGLVYAKLPSSNAEIAIRDHRHDGLFPVGEAIEGSKEYSDQSAMKRCAKEALE